MTAVQSASPVTSRPAGRPGGRAQTGLTVLGTVAATYMAGTFYAYSVSVMVGLHRTDDLTFVAAMQGMNEVTPNAWFAPSLLGALILPAAAAVVAFTRRSEVRWALVAATLAYFAAFVATIAGNVPLNQDLEAAGRVTDPAVAHDVREDFEDPWVALNHVRAVLSTGAVLALVVALRRDGREEAGAGGT